MKNKNGHQHNKIEPQPLARAHVERAALGLSENDLFSPGPVTPRSNDPALSLDAFLRRKWTIAAVMLLIAGSSLAAVWTAIQPEYSSTAVVRIASVVPRMLYKTEDNGTVPLYQAYLNTQVSIIQSPEVLGQVIDREDVHETQWYADLTFGGTPDKSRSVEKLARLLSVAPRRGTELVDVTMMTPHPQDAAVIVNAVSEEYKKYWDARQAESDQQRFATLRSQLDGVQDRINRLFEQKFQIAEKLGTNLHEEVRSQMLTRLNEMRARLSELQSAEAVRTFERDRIQAAEGTSLSKAANEWIPDELRNDPVWLRQRQELEEANLAYQLAQQQFGQSHPSYMAASSAVKLASTMLRQTEERLMPGRPPLPYEAELHEKREEELEKSIHTLLAEVTSADTLAQELAKCEELHGEQKTLRKELRDRLTALELESNAPARVSIQSPGVVKLRPARDRRLIYSACSLMAALLGGLGFGYLASRFDPTIHEAGDLSTYVPRDVPFLGQVPRAANILHEPEDTLLGQAVNENMRIIRTMLMQRLDGKGGSVLVTSPEASAGKTTVAILLARSLARLGKKVLLVDGDMLHPSVSQHFEVLDTPGLRAVVAGSSKDKNAIIPSDVNGLDILPVGQRNGVKSQDVLASGAFAAGLKRWKTEYDFVLLDCPPVLSMADARIAAGHVDGAIMVLRSSGSRREDTVEAFAGLSAAGARLLGTMLVGVEKGTAYYPYHYHARHANAELLA